MSSAKGARSAQAIIQDLYEAERALRKRFDELSSLQPEAAVLDAIAAAITAARNEGSAEERTLRLSSLAQVLARKTGARVVDLLIDILNSEETDARIVAGSALKNLAFDRFKEVAQGVERALKRLPKGSPALPELPFVLVEVPEPAVLKIVHEFLKHPDPEAVASGIEACVELGDPKSIPALEKLVEDRRLVEIDEEAETVTVTIGELAEEACEMLEGMEDEGE